jgi:hypothetical protein
MSFEKIVNVKSNKRDSSFYYFVLNHIELDKNHKDSLRCRILISTGAMRNDSRRKYVYYLVVYNIAK